jgi:hypothetical protein
MGLQGATGLTGPTGPMGPPGLAIEGNIRAPAGNCAAAAGNGTTDDTAAIQCHLDLVFATTGGGTVYFPPGNYLVSGGGLTLKGGVSIVGAGQHVVGIQSINADSSVVAIDPATCNHSSIRDVSILGYQNAGATTNAVTIGQNCAVILRDDTIWGGYSGLYNLGIDSLIENCFIAGYNAAVTSQGANWYVRDKLDTPGGYHSTYAFYQGDRPAGATSTENHFTQCDFSGDYSYSLVIQDASSSAITVIESSVLSSPIAVNSAMWTSFNNDEIGSAEFTANSGVLSVNGSFGFTTINVSGAAFRTGAGNFRINL